MHVSLFQAVEIFRHASSGCRILRGGELAARAAAGAAARCFTRWRSRVCQLCLVMLDFTVRRRINSLTNKILIARRIIIGLRGDRLAAGGRSVGRSRDRRCLLSSCMSVRTKPPSSLATSREGIPETFRKLREFRGLLRVSRRQIEIRVARRRSGRNRWLFARILR